MPPENIEMRNISNESSAMSKRPNMTNFTLSKKTSSVNDQSNDKTLLIKLKN
jgi:hypothetical protein